MKVFLDTNIIIDFYDEREEYFHPAALIIELAHQKKIQIAVSAITFVNAFYILRKSYEQEELYHAMKKLAALCIISPVDMGIIENSLALQSKDFEDAVQYQSAQSIEADVIITRNKKDYKTFQITTQTPIEFLDSFFK